MIERSLNACPPGLTRLNELSAAQAYEALLACCGSRTWAREVAAARPFGGESHVLAVAERVWRRLSAADRLEAFAAHPRIGERLAHAATRSAEWSAREQSGVRDAGRDLLAALAGANRAYEQRFGHLFIVCATGLSAGEMLRALENRLHNDPAVEFDIASAEQLKITRLRLARLLAGSEAGGS